MQAFTLLEVSIALALTIALSATLLGMLQMHISFTKMAQRQMFLAREAPRVGNLLVRLFNQADHFFVYQTVASLSDAAAIPVLIDGQAVKLFYNAPDGTIAERHLALIDVGDHKALRFFSPATLTVAAVEWTISSQVTDVDFGVGSGLLRATLTGPSAEQITYSGGAR